MLLLVWELLFLLLVPFANATYHAAIPPNGGLELTLAGETTAAFTVSSSFSEAGLPPYLHQFGGNHKPASPAWKVQVAIAVVVPA